MAIDIEALGSNLNSEIIDSHETISILTTEYLHLKLISGDDLYITEYGLPFIDILTPDNYWTDKAWLSENSERLQGTSGVWKVRTKEVNHRSKDIVFKWNRMGYDVPGAEAFEELRNAYFNSPYEEFSLVMELRNTKYVSKRVIRTQKPLAIYVLAERVPHGRKDYVMKWKIDNHKEVELDGMRSYAVIYEWIEGIDAECALKNGMLSKEEVEMLFNKISEDLKMNGFKVLDEKACHIIVKPQENGAVSKEPDDSIDFSIVDYELLERTPERMEIVKQLKRNEYFERQKNRFKVDDSVEMPPHLKRVNIFGVDYIFGHTEATGGALWVVGKDPCLFDYFLPERWERTNKTRINSIDGEIYHTLSKDNINFVCIVSKVGAIPDVDPIDEEQRKILEYGYNSPFEKVSFSIEMNEKGFPTIYPRAIYMTGRISEVDYTLLDDSRYRSHAHLLNPDGEKILKEDRNYVTIWGYWSGREWHLIEKDNIYYKRINVLQAYKRGIISNEEYVAIIRNARDRLSQLGFMDLHLRGSHLLLFMNKDNDLLLDVQGVPEVRFCHFELIRRIQ